MQINIFRRLWQFISSAPAAQSCNAEPGLGDRNEIPDSRNKALPSVRLVEARGARSVELSRDLLLLILEEADLPTLARCAATSKAYQDEAERRLYRSINVGILAHVNAAQRRGMAHLPATNGTCTVPRWAKHVQHLSVFAGDCERAPGVLLRDGMRCFKKLQCITLSLSDSLPSFTPAELDEFRRLFENFKGSFIPAWDLEIRQNRPAISPFPPGWSLATLTRLRPPQEVQLYLLFGSTGQPLESYRYLETVLGPQPNMERLVITTVDDDLCSHGQVGSDLYCDAYAAGLYSIVAPLATAGSQDPSGQEGLRRRVFPALREVVIQVPQGAKGRYCKLSEQSDGISKMVAWRPSETSIYARVQVHFRDLIAHCDAAAGQGDDLNVEVYLVQSGE